MVIAKLTSCIILIIMAATWAAISVKMGVMVSVSDNFVYLGGLLVSILTGGDFVVDKIKGRK